MFSHLTTWMNELTADPIDFLIKAVLFATALLFSLILHEVSHGFVAWKCGDPTAKMMGRLSLDPKKHLDPIGALCMVFLRIGWAKPVPINPYNFRKRDRDIILVSLAGIATNILLFIFFTFLYVFVCSRTPWMLIRNGTIYVYSAMEPAKSIAGYLLYLIELMMSFNISLAVFNLLPVPPLDGFRLANQIFFKGRLEINSQMMTYIRYGFLFICLTGVLSTAFSRVCSFCINGMIRIFSMLF